MNITASADGEKLIKVNDENIEELIINTTLAWTEMIEPELKFTVSDIIKVYSVYSNEIEYTASLFCEAIPYGYVVIGFSDDGVGVKEANISKWKEGLYTEQQVKDIYDKLWSYCKITETKESISSGGDIIYGEGNLLDAENGFVRLAKEKGYTSTMTAATNNPSVTWITDKLSYINDVWNKC